MRIKETKLDEVQARLDDCRQYDQGATIQVRTKILQRIISS